MIYIIAGIAKAGKTFITNHLVKSKKIGYFSTDLLMMSLANGNKAIGINPNASDVTVSNQLKPYLEAMIQTIIENKIDYIFEGVHFQPDFVRYLLNKHASNIKVIFLGYRLIDTSKKVEELKKFGPNTQNHWYSHLDNQALTQLVEYLKNECQIMFEACMTLNLSYYEVENIVQQTNEIMDILLNN
jgi:2-phosphoglycerate kinase